MSTELPVSAAAAAAAGRSGTRKALRGRRLVAAAGTGRGRGARRRVSAVSAGSRENRAERADPYDGFPFQSAADPR